MSSNNDYTPPKVWKWEKPRADRRMAVLGCQSAHRRADT